MTSPHLAPHRWARSIEMLAVVIALPATSALIACRDPVAPVAPTLRPVTPSYVVGKAATVVSPAPAVVATNSIGRPAAGVRVTFTRAVKDTSVELATVTTAPDGVASVEWRLGTQAVTEMVTVSADGYSPIQFFAQVEPGPASKVQGVAGDGQRGIAGFTLPGEIRVSVTDSFGNAVSGAYVEFEVEEGGGSLANAGRFTDSKGIAFTRWTLGQSGSNSLRAYVRGVAEIRFSATADDVPPMPNGAKYQLEQISFIPGDVVVKIPSWLVLGDDGHFMVYVQANGPLLGQGTYTISNSVVRLTYADSTFLLGLWSSLYYFPPDSPPITFSKTEGGTVVNGALVFHRCWTEDCYDCYWMYVPVPESTSKRARQDSNL